MNGAQKVQAQRVAEETYNHRERIAWLEGNSPRWACGTPVSNYDRNTLLRQSRDYLRTA